MTRRRLVSGDIELEEFPPTLWGDVRHAFAQSDATFQVNDGVLEAPDADPDAALQPANYEPETHSEVPLEAAGVPEAPEEDLYTVSEELGDSRPTSSPRIAPVTRSHDDMYMMSGGLDI
jgi:hypothetical protein